MVIIAGVVSCGISFTFIYSQGPIVEAMKAKSRSLAPALNSVTPYKVEKNKVYVRTPNAFLLDSITNGSAQIKEVFKETNTGKEFAIFDAYFIDLHKKIKTIDNFNFIGYGGGGFSQRDKELEEFSKKIKKENVIFITHAPPYKTKLDKLPMGNVGSVSIRKFIEKIKPILFICGHLHENENKRQKLKQTLMINPGYKGEIIEI